jgi:hypothetical protein
MKNFVCTNREMLVISLLIGDSSFTSKLVLLCKGKLALGHHKEGISEFSLIYKGKRDTSCSFKDILLCHSSTERSCSGKRLGVNLAAGREEGGGFTK